MSTPFSEKENKIYFNGKLLNKISTEKFETISYTNKHKQTYIKCLKDKKGIWFFHKRGNGILRFLTADIENFSFINDDYARDSRNVFLVSKDGFLIPNSDANSFSVLTNTPYFSKDKNQLYALDDSSGLTIYRYADCNSIVTADGHQFVSDKHNLYHYSYEIKESNDQKYLNYLDPEFPYEERKEISAFKANKDFINRHNPSLKGWWHKDYPYQIDIEGITQIGFYKTKNALFYLESNYHLKHSVPTLISSADYNSFKELNTYYGIDNKNVYYKSLAFTDVDLHTFKAIDNKLAKDNNNFFYCGNKVACDYNSFQAIDKNNLFYKDKNTLFSEQPIRPGKTGMKYEIINILKPIKNSSPSTIKIFSDTWAIDENQVYKNREPYQKADIDTFEYLAIKARFDWAKDKYFLFNNSVKKIMKGIDGKTFIALNKYWGKDLTNVVFFNTERILPSVDVETFKITDNNGGAVDKNYTYFVDDLGALKKTRKV